MNARRAIALGALTFAWLVGITPLVAQTQSPPEWKGYWIGEGLTAEISGFPSGANYKLLGGDAPWSEEGRKRLEATRTRQADQKANGWGFPLMMSSAAPMQFLITPRETLITIVPSPSARKKGAPASARVSAVSGSARKMRREEATTRAQSLTSTNVTCCGIFCGRDRETTVTLAKRGVAS